MKTQNNDLPLIYRMMKTIKNKDRKWFQIWKPKRIPNPDYIGDGLIDIEIKKGI